MLERPSRGLCDDRCQPGRPTLWNEYSMHACRFSGPDNGAQIVRVFNAVENEEKWRLPLLTGQFEDLLCAVVGFGGDNGNDPLMVAPGNQPVEGRSRLNMDGNVLGLSLLHEVRELAIGPLDEETLERAVACTQRLTNGMQPI